MYDVSVIIPVYNQEPFLRDCIKSVLNQTFTNFEIILINDGSTDASEQICREFADTDSRIKYFSQENGGVSSARNFGLKIASGKYIYFLDSDDTLDSHFLEYAYNNAESNDSDIVVLGKSCAERMPVPPALPTHACFFRKAFYDKYGILFPVGIQPCEDGLFSHQLIALTDKISLEENCIYFYRKHENQNTAQMNKQCGLMLKQIPVWFEVLKSFYNEYDLLNSKYIHLFKFIEHEPFEFRFKKMPFNEEQKEVLYNLIKDFIKDYINIKPEKEEYKNFSNDFNIFLFSENYKDYKKKFKILRCKQKVLKFLINFIPDKDTRHILRKKLR